MTILVFYKPLFDFIPPKKGKTKKKNLLGVNDEMRNIILFMFTILKQHLRT